LLDSLLQETKNINPVINYQAFVLTCKKAMES